MSVEIYNRSWLRENELRNYPLTDFATKVDKSGSFTLPDDFLVEIYLPTGPDLTIDPTKFYLQSVSVFSSGFAVVIGYDDGSSSPPAAASTVFAASAVTEFTPFALPGVGDFSASTGKLVVGKLDGILQQPPGQYTFAPAATPLDVDCIRPQLQGVVGISVTDGSETTQILSGVVNLVSGTNVRLSIAGPSAIRVDAVTGAGLTDGCACTGEATTAPAVRTIAGVAPAPDGSITIVGDSCLTVSPVAGGLQLSDSCSQPCCGCPELEKLTGELAHFGDAATTIQNFVSRLQASVDQMTQVVIGSKVADNGCVSCS